MLYVLQILTVVGIILSIYAYNVEKKKEQKQQYAPVCDISEQVSCTKAFTSKYGHTFGISNSLLGIGFYLTVLVLIFTPFASAIFYFALLSLLVSIYLAYVLYTKVKSFCLVCTTIYVVNILILVFSYLEYIQV